MLGLGLRVSLCKGLLGAMDVTVVNVASATKQNPVRVQIVRLLFLLGRGQS